MTGRNWLAVLCLVAGIALAASGLAYGAWLPAVAGIVLVLAFWYLALQWIGRAGQPLDAEGGITKSANAAWAMKDEPVATRDEEKK